MSGLSKVAYNLADLLCADPACLDEARAFAEQALAIDKTLDPGAAQIWKTYNILAEIADKQGRNDAAREYRRLSRDARDSFAGTQHQVDRILSRFKPVIEAVVAACAGDKDARLEVEEMFDTFREGNWQIVEAILAIWAGERDEEKLIDPVDYNSGVIIRAILAALRGEQVFPSANDAPTHVEEQAAGQRHQLALAAALPVLQPAARSQVEPLLEQLRAGGLTPLAVAMERLWDGEKDQTALCRDLDEEGIAVIRLALNWIDNPDELERIMGKDKPVENDPK
jgi:hypothetical protein